MSDHVQEMLILRGVPGSGKSTFAHAWVSENANWRVRINRDDTRKMIANKYWDLSQHQELTVTSLTEAMVIQALKSELSVVIDNTNLRADDVKNWYKIANEYNVPVRIQDMDWFTIDEIIENDKNRDKKVGEAVIRSFVKRYFVHGKYPAVPVNNVSVPTGRAYTPNPNLPRAIWLDLDGTVAERVHDGAPKPVRGPFDEARVGEDAVIEHIADLVRLLYAAGYKIVGMSGRSDACWNESAQWLKDNNIPFDDLFMRKSGDQRKDSIVKEEMFWNNVAPKYDIRFALDDRQQVVDHTRNVLKIPVLQVAPGNF